MNRHHPLLTCSVSEQVLCRKLWLIRVDILEAVKRQRREAKKVEAIPVRDSGSQHPCSPIPVQMENNINPQNLHWYNWKLPQQHILFSSNCTGSGTPWYLRAWISPWGSLLSIWAGPEQLWACTFQLGKKAAKWNKAIFYFCICLGISAAY